MHRQVRISPLLIFLAVACRGSDQRATVTPLGLGRTIWTAATDPDSTKPWIGRVAGLSYLGDSGTLLVRDDALNAAVELSPTGAILYRYAPRQGAGPGEIRSLKDVLATPTSVFLFDGRSHRVLRYARRGALTADFQLAHSYSAFALIGDNEIVAVPGSDGSAFDVYSVDGAFQGSRGHVQDLPKTCVENNCQRLSPCALCALAIPDRATIAIIEPTAPAIYLFDSTGVKRGEKDFSRLPFVRDWRKEADRDIASHAQERPANAIETKSFFGPPVSISEHSVAIPVLPPKRTLKSLGRELWLIDLRDSTPMHRYRYRDMSIGQFVAVDSGMSTLFAGNGDGSAIEVLSLATAVRSARIQKQSH